MVAQDTTKVVTAGAMVALDIILEATHGQMEVLVTIQVVIAGLMVARDIIQVEMLSGGSGYNPGGDVIYNGNEGYNPGYTAQQPIYNQAPIYSAPSFYQPSSGCGSSMGCGNNMMPQPMPMTRPCGSGGCPNPPVYQAGNAVTLPARMPAPVSAAQPAAPGMPPPADIDAADSSADESSSDAAE